MWVLQNLSPLLEQPELLVAKTPAPASGMALLVTVSLLLALSQALLTLYVSHTSFLPSQPPKSPGKPFFAQTQCMGHGAFQPLEFQHNLGRSFLTGQLRREGRNEVTPGAKAESQQKWVPLWTAARGHPPP